MRSLVGVYYVMDRNKLLAMTPSLKPLSDLLSVATYSHSANQLS